MVEQTAGSTIGCVYGAQEAPRFRQQFAHGGCFHFAEKGTAMDAPEVREKAKVVDSLSNDGEAAGLQGQ